MNFPIRIRSRPRIKLPTCWALATSVNFQQQQSGEKNVDARILRNGERKKIEVKNKKKTPTQVISKILISLCFEFDFANAIALPQPDRSQLSVQQEKKKNRTVEIF